MLAIDIFNHLGSSFLSGIKCNYSPLRSLQANLLKGSKEFDLHRRVSVKSWLCQRCILTLQKSYDCDILPFKRGTPLKPVLWRRVTTVLATINNNLKQRTRPDTRPSVADGWAGAEMRVFPLLDSMVTDGPTNQWTDGRTKPLIELRVRD